MSVKIELQKANGGCTLAISGSTRDQSRDLETKGLLTPYALHVKKSFGSFVSPRSLSYSAATDRNWEPMLYSSSATDILIGPEEPCVSLPPGVHW